jgi:hypothetical protein
MCGNKEAEGGERRGGYEKREEEMEVLPCAGRKEIFKAIYFVSKIHICQAYRSPEQNKLSGQ